MDIIKSTDRIKTWMVGQVKYYVKVNYNIDNYAMIVEENIPTLIKNQVITKPALKIQKCHKEKNCK